MIGEIPYNGKMEIYSQHFELVLLSAEGETFLGLRNDEANISCSVPIFKAGSLPQIRLYLAANLVERSGVFCDVSEIWAYKNGAAIRRQIFVDDLLIWDIPLTPK